MPKRTPTVNEIEYEQNLEEQAQENNQSGENILL